MVLPMDLEKECVSGKAKLSPWRMDSRTALELAIGKEQARECALAMERYSVLEKRGLELALKMSRLGIPLTWPARDRPLHSRPRPATYDCRRL